MKKKRVLVFQTVDLDASVVEGAAFDGVLVSEYGF